VFTGGDPFKRADLVSLVACARDLGLPVSLAPSGTPLMTRDAIAALRDAGIAGFSLSLDGANAEHHDAFRGVPGCFQQTLRAARWVRETGLPLQINTLVTVETANDLPALAEVLREIGITRWSLFFLIAVGRGRAGLTELTPVESEKLFRWLYRLSRVVPFAIKTTEAMHYRRVAVKQMRKEGMQEDAILRTPTGRGFGIRDGNGIMFVSHTGQVYPSGFLPLPVGNVRTGNIVTLYRDSPVFRRLRDTGQLEGKCGRCEFRDMCGGSRARAFAATGNYMAEDPLCVYQPRPARMP
jgi:radical SAM protein with 4Fe4S-binding SPASM domain